MIEKLIKNLNKIEKEDYPEIKQMTKDLLNDEAFMKKIKYKKTHDLYCFYVALDEYLKIK